MNQWRRFLNARIPFLTFLKWLIMSVIVGIVLGPVGAAFRFLLDLSTVTRQEHVWMILLLPLAGIFITYLYQRSDMASDQGTSFILVAVHTENRIKTRTAPLIFIATILTHLFGGSAGREGAALQIGAAVSTRIGKTLKLSRADQRIMTMCGMAAGFSALFGTPIASAVFAMEVVRLGVVYYSAIVPCILSSLLAHYISIQLIPTEVSYHIESIPQLNPITALQVIGLSLFFALVSIMFCFFMRNISRILHNEIRNPYYRIVAGSLIVVAITLTLGSTDYIGIGSDVIALAIAGSAFPLAFLIKTITTAFTLGSGFKGGEIVPSFFVGATFGCVAAPLIGLNPGFGAALGMVSVFCGVTNAPLASILLAFELFGAQGLAFFATSCAVSYLLSGYCSLYSGQELTYSKYLPEERSKIFQSKSDQKQ